MADDDDVVWLEVPHVSTAAGAAADNDDFDVEWVEVAMPPPSASAATKPTAPAAKRGRGRRQAAQQLAAAINAAGAASLAGAAADIRPTPDAAGVNGRGTKRAAEEPPLALELPPALQRLAHAYEAMATISAFFRARDHMVCTFEKIQRPVQELLGWYALVCRRRRCVAAWLTL